MGVWPVGYLYFQHILGFPLFSARSAEKLLDPELTPPKWVPVSPPPPGELAPSPDSEGTPPEVDKGK